MTEPTQPQAHPTGTAGGSKGRVRILLVAGAVLLLFAGLGYVGYRWMKNESLATLVEFTGGPERDTAATVNQWQAAQVGDDFDDGDGARTSKAAVARFRLINGAHLQLKPASQIRFKRSVQTGAIGVSVDMGEASVQSTEGAVTLDSQFGEIVLDANSSITMSRDGARLSVGVELGSIQLGGEKRTVKSGESVELELGGLILDVPAEPAASAQPEAEQEPEAEPEPELEVGDGVASADLVVKAGDTFVVHDPSPPTAVGFSVTGVCKGPARVVSGGQKTEAVGQANLRLNLGQHSYEVRCLETPDVVAAKGQVRVLHDAGTRKLPAFAPQANVTTDGRRYTVMYQHRLPQVTVTWPSAPKADSYTLTVDGRTIQTKAPSYTFSSLRRGTHHVAFAAATTPPRQSRRTIVEVVYDAQAPAARVSSSSLGFTPGEPVTISGKAMSGWDVSVSGKPIEVDKGQNFSADVDTDKAVPITFSHPTHGTHYYLRRPKAAAP